VAPGLSPCPSESGQRREKDGRGGGIRTHDPLTPRGTQVSALPANAVNSNIIGDDGTPPGPPTGQEGATSDAVELALADAISKASNAGQWEVVAQLGAELKLRREARAGVASLEAERAAGNYFN